MNTRYNTIIDAIIQKAYRECPGALALIGIYGSCLTGDTHEKSDLDLLILINDPRGYCLSHTFLQDDAGVGHDLYCTTWEMLESDASFRHPHISKLMDSKIVYCADDAFLSRLEALRQCAREADTRKAAEAAFADAQRFFARAIVAQEMSDVRTQAGYLIHSILDCIALLNGQYFRFGVRRIFEEIEVMAQKPENLQALVDEILTAENPEQLKSALSQLLHTVEPLFLPATATPQMCPGAYEEMFSNWRNKMYLAAETGNRYLAFDSLFGLNTMLNELGYPWNVLDLFDPEDLMTSAKAFDIVLSRVLKEYERSDIPLNRYANLDSFIEAYAKKETA